MADIKAIFGESDSEDEADTQQAPVDFLELFASSSEDENEVSVATDLRNPKNYSKTAVIGAGGKMSINEEGQLNAMMSDVAKLKSKSFTQEILKREAIIYVAGMSRGRYDELRKLHKAYKEAGGDDDFAKWFISRATENFLPSEERVELRKSLEAVVVTSARSTAPGEDSTEKKIAALTTLIGKLEAAKGKGLPKGPKVQKVKAGRTYGHPQTFVVDMAQSSGVDWVRCNLDGEKKNFYNDRHKRSEVFYDGVTWQRDGHVAIGIGLARRQVAALEVLLTEAGKEKATEKSATDANNDNFKRITDALWAHELEKILKDEQAGRDVSERLAPRARVAVDRCRANYDAAGASAKAKGVYKKGLRARWLKSRRTPRLTYRKYFDSKWAPHNNTKPYQEARKKNGNYRGRDYLMTYAGV